MGLDHGPLLARPGVGGFCALNLSFPACDLKMMVPTSQAWGVDSGRSGRGSSQFGAQ